MSGAVIRYWRERLEGMCPYVDEAYLQEPWSTLYFSVDRPKRWPSAVNTVTFYEDFAGWWRGAYALPLDAQSELPKQPHERHFFGVLRDFLFLGGKNPRLRKVPVPRLYQGSEFAERRYRRFVLLKDWREHAEVFEALTKSTLSITQPVDCKETQA